MPPVSSATRFPVTTHDRKLPLPTPPTMVLPSGEKATEFNDLCQLTICFSQIVEKVYHNLSQLSTDLMEFSNWWV